MTLWRLVGEGVAFGGVAWAAWLVGAMLDGIWRVEAEARRERALWRSAHAQVEAERKARETEATPFEDWDARLEEHRRSQGGTS